MKKYCFLLVLALLSIGLSAQQAKRVYITLDVSGSMTGDKYSLANYTTQMIVSLCDEADEVHMIVYGVDKCLSDEKNPLKLIQKPMQKIKFGPSAFSGNSQFDDIMAFNAIYKPSEDKQDWLFIIGDGIWGTLLPNSSELNSYYEPDLLKYKKIVGDGSLNVCYLQTGHNLNEDNDFTRFSSSLGVVDIRKSDINPKTIREGCDHFARKILGFSDVSLKVKKSGSKCVSIEAELPIQSFYLVYQDETVPEKLPEIANITADGQSLNFKLKGTPTTIPTKSQTEVVDLSGNVWYVTSSNSIPANTKIEVCFDKGIDPNNISIYPLVENVDFCSFGISPAGGKLKQIDGKTFCISSNEKKAVVRIELNGASKETLPESLLKKTTVVVKANNKDYEAKYKDGGFECVIDLKDEETQYYAECDCPGYFKRVTPITTIEKGDCEPEPITQPELPVQELPVMNFDPMTFEALKHDPLRFYIHNVGEKDALDPQKFDISVKVENPYLYEDPKISFDNDTVVLDLRPKGRWCECLFPEEVNFTIISTPKEGAFQEGINYSRMEKPGRVPLIKDRPWFVRCFWVLVTLAALLVFILYLRALLKKNRFHKNARLKNSYVVEDSPQETQKNGKPLRKPGLGAWLNRWFNPFSDEKNTISFSRPKTPTMTFAASESKNKVLLGNGYDSDKMTIPMYNPQPQDKDKKKKREPIPISAGTSIEIKKTQGGETTRLGHVKYVVEGKDDEGGYRFFIGLLMVLSIVSFVALVIMLLRGIL
jgi:hypothetical protein